MGEKKWVMVGGLFGCSLIIMTLFQNCSGFLSIHGKSLSSSKSLITTKEIDDVALQLQQRFVEVLQDNEALLFTFADSRNLSFACLKTYSDCGKDKDANYYLNWRPIGVLKSSTDELIFDSTNSSLGFYTSLEQCHEFGSPSCFIRPEFMWFIKNCDEPCFDPEIEIMVRIHINNGKLNEAYTTQPTTISHLSFRTQLINICDGRGGIPSSPICHIARQYKLACAVDYGAGQQTFQGANPIESCQVNSCEDGYTIFQNQCVANQISCGDSNGEVFKHLNLSPLDGSYGDCVVSSCDSGFIEMPGRCISPISCAYIKSEVPDATDGIYQIDPDGVGGNEPYNAYCDMLTDGGGWTLVAKITTDSTWGGCVGGGTCYWTGNNTLNVEDLDPNVKANSKYDSYNQVSIKELRGITHSPNDKFIISLPETRASLLAVMSSNTKNYGTPILQPKASTFPSLIRGAQANMAKFKIHPDSNPGYMNKWAYIGYDLIFDGSCAPGHNDGGGIGLAAWHWPGCAGALLYRKGTNGPQFISLWVR